MEPARERATASAASLCQACGPSGALLVRGDKVREWLGQESVAGQSGRADGVFDGSGLAFDLDQDVHRGIPLDANGRRTETVFSDLPIDPQHDLVSEVFEDLPGRFCLGKLRLVLLTMLVAFAHRGGALPSEDAELRAGIGLVNAEPQHFIALFEFPIAIVAAIDHLAAKYRLRTRGDDRGLECGGIVDPRLQLDLVAGIAHANSACRTACVSLRFSNTCVAPQARSASTLKNPVATATVRAPIGPAHATSSGVSPTTTMSSPAKRRPVRSEARLAATAGRSARRCESEPNAPTANRAGSSPAERSLSAAPCCTLPVRRPTMARPAASCGSSASSRSLMPG